MAKEIFLLSSLTCRNTPLYLTPFIVKLSAYGFDTKLKFFISSFLKNAEQKTKIGSTFSKCQYISFGALQGSILGHFSFLIFIANLFYSNCDLDFIRYANDTTLYICGEDFSSIMKVLKANVNKVLNCFQKTSLIANSGKSHFLSSPYERRSLKIHDSMTQFYFQFLRRTLEFYDHSTRLCSKANQKLSALARFSKYMTLPK